MKTTQTEQPHKTKRGGARNRKKAQAKAKAAAEAATITSEINLQEEILNQEQQTDTQSNQEYIH